MVNNSVVDIKFCSLSLCYMTILFQIIYGGIELTEDIAIDWVGGNMYWTDYVLETVEVATLEGKHRTVLFSENLGNPRSIVLDPSEE